MQLKIFGRNTIIYALGNIGLRISSFLLIPFYTHTLLIEDYGRLATILMTIQILISIMGLGTERAFTRFAAEYHAKNQTGLLFSTALQLNLVVGLSVTMITVYLFQPIFRDVLHLENVTKYILLACGVALTQSLFLNIINYYRTFNEGLKYTIAGTAAAFFLILSTLTFLLVFNMSISGVLLAQIMTYSILGFFIFLRIILKTGISISMIAMKKVIYYGFPLVFAMSADLVLDTTAFYFIGFFSDLKSVAIYSIGYKLAQVAGMILILPFQLALEPFIFANLYKPNIKVTISKLLTYLCLLFAFVALAIVFISRQLITIIAPAEYSQSYVIIFLLLPGIAFMGVHYIGQSLLHIKNKSYITGITATIFTILSVILNYFFIKTFGVYGAVLIFNFTLIGSALVLMILGIRTFPVPLEKIRLLIIGIISFFSLTFVFLLKDVDYFIYYSIVPIVSVFIISLLYILNFFDDEEKSMINGFLFRMLRLASR